MSVKTDHSYDYHTFLSRCSCKYLPEVTAGTGLITNLGGSIVAIVFKAYIAAPFGLIGAAGFAGCYWFARKVRLRSEDGQTQGNLVQIVIERAANQTQAHESTERIDAENKLTEEMRRRKIDEDVESEPSAEESVQIRQELQGLLSELENYRTDYEKLHEKFTGYGQELGIESEEEKTPTLYTVSQVHTNIGYLHQVRNNVGVLQQKGLEIFSLLSSFVEKLTREKEGFSRVASDQNSKEMVRVIAQLEIEAANLKEQLSSALSRIQELENERKELLQKVQKS